MSTSVSADSLTPDGNPKSADELKTIVKVNEPSGESWKEVAAVTTVSRNGAAFALTRACTVGRLVMLVLPLAPELRAYDRNAPNYPVIGLVQYCNEGRGDNGEKIFHTGVAFIGRTLPESYKSNAGQSYHVCGMTEDGLWRIAESQDQYKARKHPRFSVALGVTVTLLGRARGENSREQTFTQNVSATGMSVVSGLDAQKGDRVKIGCKELDFYAIANVRNRDQKNDKPATLHLEFVEAEFPMEKLYCGQTDVMPSTSVRPNPTPAQGAAFERF